MGSGSNRSGFLPFFVFILSIFPLFSCNKNISGKISKKDSGKPEMMAKSGEGKTMDSKSFLWNEGGNGGRCCRG